jgi:hypothetical protein
MEKILEMSRADCRGNVVYAADRQSEGQDVSQGFVDKAHHEKVDVAEAI